MTPKEKAEAIYRMYNELVQDHTRGVTIKPLAKQCALIAVDECINIHYNLESDRNGIGESHKYWQEVKQEIEKL